MGKTFGKCKLCKPDKFLNFAGLCKKCNRKGKGSMIKEELTKKHQESIKIQKEKRRQNVEENIEKKVLEKKDDLSAEQKKRLVELTPGIQTIAELEKEKQEKNNENGIAYKDDDKDSK